MACQSCRSSFLFFFFFVQDKYISNLFKQRKLTSIYVNTVISKASAAKNINRELHTIKLKENRTGILHAKSLILNSTSVFLFKNGSARSGFYWQKTKAKTKAILNVCRY